MRKNHYIVTNYWLAFYVKDHCTLCGNSGIIDTRGAMTAARISVGRLNWCICPNGQWFRTHKDVEPTEKDLLKNRS